MTNTSCPLCQRTSENLLWSNSLLRVVLVDDPLYPGFCRVILNHHVKEMSDLPPAERLQLMHTVFAVETALRELLAPEKINLASLGNQVPHLHWHVIPRFSDDAHFPDPVWAAAQRAGRPHPVDSTYLAQRIAEQLLDS